MPRERLAGPARERARRGSRARKPAIPGSTWRRAERSTHEGEARLKLTISPTYLFLAYLNTLHSPPHPYRTSKHPWIQNEKKHASHASRMNQYFSIRMVQYLQRFPTGAPEMRIRRDPSTLEKTTGSYSFECGRLSLALQDVRSPSRTIGVDTNENEPF